MTRYTSATDADRRAMLDAIGAESVDELMDAAAYRKLLEDE